jgi:hypothetical protein
MYSWVVSAWENSDSVLQKVTFCWIGFSARTRKVLDGGMPTKRWLGWWRPPFLCFKAISTVFEPFFGLKSGVWEEESWQGQQLARTMISSSTGIGIGIHTVRKKLCAIYFSGGMESQNSFLLGLLYGCYMCDIARWGNLWLHHDTTMPHIRAGCTLQPACLAAIAGRMWHC